MYSKDEMVLIGENPLFGAPSHHVEWELFNFLKGALVMTQEELTFDYIKKK
ncbi:hypothetical protein ACI2OX_03470 [Bacillus sp. N9]